MRTLGEIQPGQTVGRYEFLVPIAQGGMAAVWAARLKGTRGFSKNVAVKMMLPTISDDPQFEQMFLDEAQIASRIRHPNCVEILDLGEQDDLLYLVMEWVDGEPLSSIRRAAAKKDGIPRPIAVKIVADAAAGLHAAHELKDEDGKLIGIVHRDISPQNILITYDGVVKIVDFGVAKAAGRTSEATSAGQIKGKPPYMSPEQALGKDVDRRTDVFALGIILYQLTTGKHPFRGESDIVTLQNIVSDRPIIPPRAYDREYPKPLEAVVMKALERDPEKRYQSSADLEGALDRVFPPTVPRVRTEDVGKFVTAMLGERGEERRTALKDAIKQADERVAGADDAPATAMGRPLGELGTTVGMPLNRPSIPSSPTGPSGVSARGTPSSIDAIPLDGLRPSFPSEQSSSGPLSMPHQTPFGTQTPSAPPPQKSRGLLWVMAGLVVAGLFVGGALFVTKTLGDSKAAAAAPPAAPTPETPSEAPPDETAEAEEPKPEEPVAKTEDETDSDAIDVAARRRKEDRLRPAHRHQEGRSQGDRQGSEGRSQEGSKEGRAQDRPEEDGRRVRASAGHGYRFLTAHAGHSLVEFGWRVCGVRSRSTRRLQPAARARADSGWDAGSEGRRGVASKNHPRGEKKRQFQRPHSSRYAATRAWLFRRLTGAGTRERSGASAKAAARVAESRKRRPATLRVVGGEKGSVLQSAKPHSPNEGTNAR